MAAAHDDNMFQAFQSFTSTHSNNPLFRELVHLPIKLNGAGITAATPIAPLAYVSSVADGLRLVDSKPFEGVQQDIQRWATSDPQLVPLWEGAQEVNQILMSFKEELDSFRRQPGNHAFQESHINQPSQLPCTVPQLLTSQPKLQHRLSLMHHEISHRNFLSSVSSALKASLLSNRQYGASLCFNIIPSCPELVISNEVFQFFVQSHLCVRLLSDNQGPATCTCAIPLGSPSNSRVVNISHMDNCPLGGGTVDRHDALAQVASQFFIAAGFQVHKDFHKQGPSSLKPDLTVFGFPSVGQSSFVEVSVTNPLASQSVRDAVATPLSAATACESAKIKKYKELARAENRSIYTFVLESTGAFGKGVKEILSTACASADISPHNIASVCATRFPPSFRKFWSQRFAVTFWQGSLQMQKARAHSIAYFSRAHPSPVFPRHIARVYRNPSNVSASSYHPSFSFNVNHNSIPVVPYVV